MPPKRLSIPRKNWDPKILEQRRLRAEAEHAAARREREAKEDKNNSFARIMQFVVALWAVRLGIYGFGTAFGGVQGLLSKISYYTGLDAYLFLPRHDLASWQWSRTVLKMPPTLAMDKTTPFVTYGVPTIEQESIQQLLRNYRFQKNAFVSVDRIFHYLDSQAPWGHIVGSTEERESCSVREIGSFPFRSEDCEEEGYTGGDPRPHWYLSEPLDHPLSNSFLNKASPAFMEYLRGSISLEEAQGTLWMSSEGAECGAHYDVDHNFFLQLSGSKTFFIVEPAALPLFHPYSSLHPRWRQARNSSLNSVPSVINAAQEARASALWPFPIHADEGPWEVTLQAGDMLYLPPYYYHAVRGGPAGSASVNVWMPSAMHKVKQLIVKSTSMPFSVKDNAGVKARNLVAASKLAFSKLGLPVEKARARRKVSAASASAATAANFLPRLMRERHPPTFEDKNEYSQLSVAGLALQEHCQGEATASYGDIEASSDAMASLLVAELKDPSVRLHVLLDIIDELFDVGVMGGKSTPAEASIFVNNCFD
jgi:hypothetical protein